MLLIQRILGFRNIQPYIPHLDLDLVPANKTNDSPIFGTESNVRYDGCDWYAPHGMHVLANQMI
jgi:hypothetical protein